LLQSLKNAVALYRELRQILYGQNIILHEQAEKKVMEYFDQMEYASKTKAAANSGIKPMEEH
jgi:hypothetical protein